MAKRFTDTDKYKKPFIRGLQGAYKLFWDYIYHDCNHAGIWIVDFEIAQIYLGKDMQVNKEDSLKYFNNGEDKIIEIDGGKKWFIPSFIEFQYGELNISNRVHASVIQNLNKYGIEIKGLTRPLQGCKDKDKDKYKDMDKEKEKDKEPVINNTILLEERRSSVLSDLNYDVCKGFMEYIKEYHHNKVNSLLRGKESWQVYEQWINDIRLLNNRGYDRKTILDAMKRAMDDDFWRNNFYTISKLNTKNKHGIYFIDVFLDIKKSKNERINDMLDSWLEKRSSNNG